MTENRNCKNCSSEFVIEPDDFSFYEKIKVPPPTWCPECRLMRRMSFRNELTFYKRTCDLCKENIIAAYPSETPFPVYCRDCWYSDKWDSRDYGTDFNFNESFFAQFKQLMAKVPRPALIGSNNVNSPYMNYTADVKNCYYAICSAESENCGYIYRTFRSKECSDCFGAVDSEYTYEATQCSKCFRTSFAENSENVIESTCVKDCRNVSNCLGCVNLKNQQYQYLNRPITKEEYETRRSELGSYEKMGN